ncbi:MAG: DUF3152 domain-containing protein [Acidimicrobiia bacterium]|nr:DUF3152 domain-containing protein [Acidimicrobiia bacterium]
MRLRAPALVGLILISALANPIGAGAAESVMGHPRCNLEGVAADYTWWIGDEHAGFTATPEFEYQGTIYTANEVDCAAAVDCLSERPTMSGRAATFVGSPTLIGTLGPDLLVGSDGPDVLRGRRGADTLCGGVGNDLILGGRGADVVIGGPGRDEIHGGIGADMLNGGGGHDTIVGGGGIDTMLGRFGRDSLYGGAGDDAINGGSGRDVCFGGPDSDVFLNCAVDSSDDVIYGSGPVHTLRVQIDPLLDESEALFAAYVDWILSDPRSWSAADEATWHRVGSQEDADLTIILGAPATVDAICFPLITGGYFSCRNGDTIGINVDRWNTATDWWPASLHVYRTYVINHEVGHFLGHGHTSCPGPGKLAKVMQQQTKTLDGCVANGWPHPNP